MNKTNVFLKKTSKTADKIDFKFNIVSVVLLSDAGNLVGVNRNIICLFVEISSKCLPLLMYSAWYPQVLGNKRQTL